jgi:hypothetical protein
VQIKEQYQVKISNRFAAFKHLGADNVEIKMASESITEYI